MLLLFLTLSNMSLAIPEPEDKSLDGLKDAIGNGYTPYLPLDTRIKPGTIFTLEQGVYTIVSSNCVEAEPVENASASVGLRSKLSGGVSAQILGKGAKANLTEELELKFISPYISGYEALDFRPSQECVQRLTDWMTETFHTVSDVFIVREVFFAQVNGCTKVTGGAGVKVNKIDASASITKACDRFSGSNYVAVGYKSESLTQFLSKETTSAQSSMQPTTYLPEKLQIEGGDIGALLKMLEAQEKMQAQLADEINERLAVESAPILAKAEKEWIEVQEYTLEEDEAGKLALEGFIKAYSEVNIVVDGKRMPIEIPQLAEALKTLENYVVKLNIDSNELFDSVLVQGGTYEMGCKGYQCELDSQPAHLVTLTNSIQVMTTEVTQDLYTHVMNSNPSQFSNCGGTCPVENVSWYDAVDFANELNKQLNLEQCYEITGQSVQWPKGYNCQGWRLPTEAEWEYLARASEPTAFAGSNDAQTVAVTQDMNLSMPYPVGNLYPNAYNLFDLSGNVYEWCWDKIDVYKKTSQRNPMGSNTGQANAIRGGSWSSSILAAKVTTRGKTPPESKGNMLGFRLVRTHLKKELHH